MADAAAFCQSCGARREPENRPALRRSQVDRQIAGLCGGIARYLDVDPVFVRVLWVALSIVPGTILLGVLAYAVGWLIVPEAAYGTEPIIITSGVGGRKRLQRSTSDVTIGGVCGGIAEYFQVDATAVRLLWVVLSVFPGLIIGGLLVYVLVWLIMPAPPEPVAQAQTEPPPPPPPASTPDAAGAGTPE